MLHFVCDQEMKGHEKMILEMIWDHDKSYMFTASVDSKARSWMPDRADRGTEGRIFEGAPRSITKIYLKGNICKWGGIRVVAHLICQTL